MQPTGPTAPPPPGPFRPGGPLETTLRLQVGQILEAVVAKDSEDGNTLLRLGARLLLARTGELQLTEGQRLRLQVATLGRLPLLKLVTAAGQDPLGEALRRILPEQRPLPQGLGALAAAVRPTRAPALPAPVTALIRTLFQNLPEARQATTPEGLRQALERSGQFLEARLAAMARNGTPFEPQKDFRAGLLRLAAALERGLATASTAPRPEGTPAPPPQAARGAPPAAAPAGEPPDPRALFRRGQPPRPQPSVSLARAEGGGLPPSRQELLALVQATLSRLRLNQLASHPRDRQQPPEWVVELPLRRDDAIDVWSLRIRRDDAGEGEKGRPPAAPAWTVLLAFDLPGLGPMQARVTLLGQERVRALFLGGEDTDLPRVSRHLPRLRTRLEAAGLVVDSLACRKGRLQALPPPSDAPGLLDEKA